MKTLTIRNVPDAVHAALRVRAARHGWSMEEEVRRTLAESVAPEAHARGLSPAEGHDKVVPDEAGAVYPEGREREGDMQGFAEAPRMSLTGTPLTALTAHEDARAAVEELRALIRAANKGRLPLGVVDELVAERRAEAAHDLAEHARSVAERRARERER